MRKAVCKFILVSILCASAALVKAGGGVFTASAEYPAEAAVLGKTVRIAYPVQEGLTYYDGYGNRTGYIYEYLEEVAQYTGWDYEFVTTPEDEFEKEIYKGLSDEDIELIYMQNEVAAGRIDLMGGMLYNEALAEIYDYSSHSNGVVETVLQALDDATEDIVINSQLHQSYAVAVAKSALENYQNQKEDEKRGSIAELMDFCKINMVEPAFVPCENDDEMMAALKDGRAQMMLNRNMNYIEGVTTVARFASKPFYFVTRHVDAGIQGVAAQPGIMKELNEAMLGIERADPYFTARLFEKYFSPNVRTLRLTEDERAFIAAAGPIRVGVVKNRQPYQHVEKGAYRGIGVEMLGYVAEKTGLTFTFAEAADDEALYALADAGKIDVVAAMTYDYEVARKRKLAMTRSYVSAQYALLMKSTADEADIKGKRLAVSESSSYHGEFVGNVTLYPTVADCIEAVSKGRADYTYVDAYTSQYYLNQPHYSNLKSVPQSYTPKQTCFGLVKPVDREMLSVFNKVVSSITEIDSQAIVNRNVISKQKYSLLYLIRENPIASILIIAGILGTIIAVLVVFSVQRAKSNKKSALELEKHYRVYALVKEYFIEYNFRTRKLLSYCPPGSGDDQPSVADYDFGDDSLSDPEVGQRKRAFLEAITTGEDGVRETYLECVDGSKHWLRIALETVYDHGAPAYRLGKLNVIDEEKRKEDSLIEKASLDSLTRVLNSETLRKEICGRMKDMSAGELGGLLLLDVDNFKTINDTYGHLEGDRVLVAVAGLLKKSCRESDLVGRPGGDEFIVYLSRVRSAAALENKCAELIEKGRSIESGDKHITFSMGAALVRPGDDYNAVYKSADNALYDAKRAGRDRYRLVSDQTSPSEAGSPEK